MMMTPALAPTPPAATPAATIAAAGDAIATVGKAERQARSRKKKGGKDKDMPETAAQLGGCAGGREEADRQPKFDGTSILNCRGDSAVDVFLAVDGCESHDPMMEECEIRPSTSTIGGSGPAASYLPAVGARKAEALEDPLDFELMDELLRKYNRLQESSQRLEQDTKVAVVRELLEVLDELERAGASLTESESTKASQMVRAVAAKFEAKLRGLGLRRVEALRRPFDPRLHRAVERSATVGGTLLNVDFVAESPELPTQLEEVTEELESGWVLGDVVVRPALVATGRHGPEEA
jgi:molecular chaperone GrpE (heat shock protein)